MITIIWNAFKIIFLLGFLITIHELGHFTVAKLCKVKVNEFAIGFGPKIFSKQGKVTKYSLRLISLGGYVSMEGEEEHSDEEGSFTKAPIYKRILIVLAGATVNIVFALIVYFILAANSGTHVSTVVKELIPNYAAEDCGILPEDKIIKINNKNTNSIEDINNIINKSNGEELEVTVRRNNDNYSFIIKPTEVKYKATGIYLYQNNSDSTKVAGIEKNGSAKKAGIKTGDIIVEANGEKIENNLTKLLEIINDEKNSEINIKVNRRGETLVFKLVPNEYSKYYLGIYFKQAQNNFLNNIYYGLLDTKEFVVSIMDNLKGLFSGKVSVDQFVGPVGISQVVAETNGFRDFIYMLAIISLSLGITNLMPFPPLDGGKVVFLIIEAIRRKPIKQEIELKIQLIGFAILILLSIYITYNDILRIL